MILRTTPVHALSGEVSIPGDKSISHRALLLSAIAEGQSVIHGFLEGEDTLALLNALKILGVSVTRQQQSLFVQGVGLRGFSAPKQPLNLGNSGTAMRLLAGILAAQTFKTELIGDDSLSARPMRRVMDPLQKMGAHITSTDHGTAPLIIFPVKKLCAIHYELPIASAQLKSAVLFAGLHADGVTTIIEKMPTRDHTERMLTLFCGDIKTDEKNIQLTGQKKLSPTIVTIPGDLSSAAFLIVAATIIPNSTVYLKNVGINPTRLGAIFILRAMGADIQFSHSRIVSNEPVADIIVRSAHLKGIEIPAEWVPLAIDEFPILFIAAACAKGATTLRGASELRVKESDRITGMVKGLQNLGIRAQELPDGVIIEGGKLCGGNVDAQHDHRLAMAFATAGGVAEREIIIQDGDTISTSFPNFLELVSTIGIKIEAT